MFESLENNVPNNDPTQEIRPEKEPVLKVAKKEILINGEPKGSIEDTYDENGVLLKTIESTAEGRAFQGKEYVYDEQGRKIEEKHLRSLVGNMGEYGTTRFSYHDNGMLRREFTKETNFVGRAETTKSYDESGLLISHKMEEFTATEHGFKSPWVIKNINYKYELDENGRPLKREGEGSGSDISEYDVTNYKYNPNNPNDWNEERSFVTQNRAHNRTSGNVLKLFREGLMIAEATTYRGYGNEESSSYRKLSYDDKGELVKTDEINTIKDPAGIENETRNVTEYVPQDI